MKKYSLLIDSLFNKTSSLGNVGYNITRCLEKKEDSIFDVYINPWGESKLPDELFYLQEKKALKMYDFAFRKSDPCSASHNSGRTNIGNIACIYYDLKDIEQGVVEEINDYVDLLLVPSGFVKEKFLNFGVTIPIEVLPLGVDLDVFKPLDIKKDNKFRFINYGEQGKRKGTDLLVKAFEEFAKSKDDVELKLICSYERDFEQVENINHPKIKVHKGTLPIEKLVEEINKSNCFIAASRDDSFGMGGLESMACGLPVIASRKTGYSQYITELNGYLCNCKVSLGAAMQWEYEPDLQSFVGYMNSLYFFWKNDKPVFAGVCANAVETAQKYSWEKIVDKLQDIIIKQFNL
jgi:glycosyltransferase involved in cell wall biosynthesis